MEAKGCGRPATLREDRDLKRAKKLDEYLASPEARKVFEKFGFIVVP